MAKVFVSYSHNQGDWVWNQLVPCLQADGAEVFIDRERFEVGKAVVGQMDIVQNQAEKHVLVLSYDYFRSAYCQHEMDQAIRLDPHFKKSIVLPVLRCNCTLPTKISKYNPLYADLRDASDADQWKKLLAQCGMNQIGASAPDWLAARNEIVRFLNRKQSVNLVVHGNANWRALLTHTQKEHLPHLAIVNLEDPDTTTRRGLLVATIKALGELMPLPENPDDLAGFKKCLMERSSAKVCLTHFDLVPHRPYYDIDLFATLRYLIMEERKLTLLVQSRTAFNALLPRNHPLSTIDIMNVELKARA